MNLLRKFVDLIIYSNVWIGLCAVAQVQLTYLLIDVDRGPDIYSVFIFTSTLSLYCWHRVIGIRMVPESESNERFNLIRKYSSHILVYGILGLLGAIASFLFLSREAWLYLVIPGLVSIGYIIPVGKSGKRFRDYPIIKIFLIAAVWSVLTAWVPLTLYGSIDSVPGMLILFERIFFTFGLVVPFDIRDQEVDGPSRIKTIPHLIGERQSKLLGIVSIVVSCILAGMLISGGTYPHFYTVPLVLYGLLGMLVIWYSDKRRSDYYFAGLVDGVMVAGYLLVMFGRTF